MRSAKGTQEKTGVSAEKNAIQAIHARFHYPLKKEYYQNLDHNR